MMEEDYNLELIKDFEKREKENKVELISLSDFRKEILSSVKPYFFKSFSKTSKKLQAKCITPIECSYLV